jgi:hypothetical protein
MQRALLQRQESGPDGTFGRLGNWFTLERPWVGNQTGKSCIPVGDYEVTWSWSPHLGRMTYLLLGTAPRTGIRIHSANLMTELLGCIALGEKRGMMHGRKCIYLSSPAVRAFEAAYQSPFILSIKGA